MIPSGAQIYIESYENSEKEWQSLAKTPLDSIEIPIGFSEVKFELEGHRPAYDIIWNDPAYAFNDAFAQSPFDRSEKPMASIFLATETRFKAAILLVAGLTFQRALPEVDEPRIYFQNQNASIDA